MRATEAAAGGGRKALGRALEAGCHAPRGKNAAGSSVKKRSACARRRSASLTLAIIHLRYIHLGGDPFIVDSMAAPRAVSPGSAEVPLRGPTRCGSLCCRLRARPREDCGRNQSGVFLGERADRQGWQDLLRSGPMAPCTCHCQAATRQETHSAFDPTWIEELVSAPSPA